MRNYAIKRTQAAVERNDEAIVLVRVASLLGLCVVATMAVTLGLV